MKRFTILVMLIVTMIFGQRVVGQTTLVAGDAAVIAMQTDNADQFAFVTFVDLQANTVINFTDNGMTSPTTFRTGEGVLTFTAPTAIAAGAVLTWTNGMDITGTGWSSNAPTNFSFNASGDQLFIFQGTWNTSVTFIYGLNIANTGWLTTGTPDASSSYLPSGLVDGTSAIHVSALDNGYYNIETNSGSAATLLSSVSTNTNWVSSDTRYASLPAWTFTVSSGGLTPPVLTADATSNNVDNNIDITFTDDATWRAAVTDVTIGGVSLGAGDYVLSAGNLQLVPSNGNSLLTTAGSKSVSVVATGYNNASVTQVINAGAVVAGNSSTSITPDLSLNTASTVTCNAFDQYNNPVSGYAFRFDLQITDNDATTDESYLVDGTAYTSSPSPVTLTTLTNASGVSTFGVTVPAFVDVNDGFSLQVQTASGTNVGTAFTFTPTDPVVQVTGADPSSANCLVNSTNNVLYRAALLVVNDVTTLSALSVAAAGNYQSADIPANGFKLWFSADNAFSAGSDVMIGQVSSASAGSGETLSFTGLSQEFGIGTNYLFITADIDAAATPGRTISAALTSNANFTLTAGTTFSGSTYGAANLHLISLAPVMNELVVPQYFGGKTTATTNTHRAPFAICLSFENLNPSTTYDIRSQIGLTSEAATAFGAGNIWNGTAFSGSDFDNAFTTDASGNSGPVWLYFQPTANSSRFGAGQQHNIRVACVPAGGSFSNPMFVSTKVLTALDIAASPATPATTDDGAFIYGISGATYDGKFTLVYSNEAGTGDPLFAYQARQAAATNSTQAGFPVSINEVYTQAGASVTGDFPAIIPIGANNPDGVRRIEFRNADNTVFDAVTNATGDWGSGANTAAIVQREVMTINVTSSPSVSATPTTLSGFITDPANPSAAQSFAVSGENLTANIFVNGPADYEISLSEASGYTSSIELTQTGGSVSSTTIFVRLKSGLTVGDYNSEVINITSAGATSATVTCSGSVSASGAVLIADPTTLSGFSYAVDDLGPSVSQYYTLSSTTLTGFPGVITVTGSTNFEVSSDDVTYGESFTIEYTSSTIEFVPVFVRLKAGLPIGTYGPENIVNSGGGAASVNVSCSGTVTGPVPTALCLTRPTHIDISTATSQSAVLMKLKNYTSDLVKYRLYSGSNQYYPWDESIDAFVSSTSYASGPNVPGTPTTSTTFWVLFERGSNNSVDATYRDRLSPYTTNNITFGLPTANSITVPFSLSGNFVPYNGYDNTVKHVVLAYSNSVLVSATSTTLSTGAFNLVCPDGTTIDLIEVRAIDNTLIASITGSWNTTTVIGNVPDLPVTAAPVITPASGNFYASFTASISCTTPSSSIYYTTDGSDPDNAGNGTLYTIPVSITGTTTLKAIAYAPGFDPSVVVSATYTFPVINDVANIAALRASAADGTTIYRLTGEAVLTFKTVSRNAKYIQDATGAILIDDNTGKITTTYSLYDGITGITGTLSNFNSMLQFVPVIDPGAATSTGNVVVPEEVTLATLNTSHQAKLVKILNTTITGVSPFVVSTNYVINDPSGAGFLRTQYSDLDYLGTDIPAEPQDLTAVILQFNTTMQVVPRSLADFTVSTGPILTATPNTLTGFGYAAGNGPSTSQSYVLEGSNLSGYPGNISVSAAGTSGYEVSTDDITFAASVNVPFTASALSATTVYVRLKAGLTAGAYNSEIIVNNGGGILLPVNVTCSGTVLAGEPTNHVTAFAADSPLSSAIVLTWDDNDGVQPADGFLVLANTTGIFTAPVDGTPVTNDANLGDASAAMNVAHGVETLTFGGLTAATTYYFAIYPYTNAGALIDYKTDPAAPEANATTLAAALPIAAWTFDATNAAPNTPNAIAANYGNQLTAMFYADGTNGSSLWASPSSNPQLTAFGGSTLNDPRPTQVSGNAITLANSSANGQSVVFKYSMTGYENPIITFVTRGTSTGFNTHQWAWSTDNVTYTNFGTNTANTTSSFLLRTLDLSTIDAVDQAAEVYIRLTVSGASSATGNNRLDNIVIDATPAAPSTKTLNVTAFLEGLYEAGTGEMRQALGDSGPQFGAGIADEVTVELHDATAPYAAAYTFTNVSLSTAGNLSISTIPAVVSGSYYIAIKHRNSIETWSSNPVSFDGAGPFSYDFTTAASQAFGDNMLQIGSVYVIFGGDVNQDGSIDTSDMTVVDNGAAEYLTGYILADVNGDGGVDTSDMTIIDNSSSNYVGSAHP
ncbi:MAG: chitobiase/beta-hexosaminidase C-terminal domain-containing protein [Bacteroidales bacterium]|nr:chitobiase/beta-hexosaminidase C-terminal domain-containing protein [Bacteroidales bacterium]